MFLGPGEDKSAAAAEPRWEAGVMQPVPAGARVRLEAGRSEFFLGENVLVHFILENVGSQPFEMAFGGDYRGASRALRFKVTATDEAGRIAEDPDPSPLNFGGLGGTRTLKPGERFVQSLPLMRYAQLERPGRYKIVATHDFGWKAGPLPHPTGELTLTFRLPDAAQAEQVLAQMEKLPTDPSTRFGEKARDYADFSCLRAPAYLGPLVRRAQAGVPYALAGLEQIPTPEATAALIQLAGAADPKVARAAALSLTGRLPAAAPAKGAWTGG
ncbi:MAG TPA: HEAT repeat domain-containing protein, partial [Pseudomonadota bacterium]|nr:HEAT repeat domain-containing protein [Pseudomonadota bacterium]